jgi:UDP-N-acetylmuramyl tripeptide synthase
VIAGKGHERTQQIGRELRAFDDRSIVRQALKSSKLPEASS